VTWAQPRHLAIPGLAIWRSPGGDQKILKWGGERWQVLYYLILISVPFCSNENFNAHYTAFSALEMSKKRGHPVEFFFSHAFYTYRPKTSLKMMTFGLLP